LAEKVRGIILDAPMLDLNATVEHGAKQLSALVRDLEERAKELKCLYKIENVLNDQDAVLNAQIRNGAQHQ